MPPSPRDAAADRAHDRRPVLHGRDRRAAARGVRRARLAARPQAEVARDHRPLRRRRRRCCCSSAARCRRSGSGGCREAGRRRAGRRCVAALADARRSGRRDERVPRAQPVRRRSPARGSSSRRRARPAAAGAVPAHVPARLRRRRHRRRADRPRDRRLLPRHVRQPGLHRASRPRARVVFVAAYVGTGARAADLPPAHRLHPRHAAAGGGRRPRLRRSFPPGAPDRAPGRDGARDRDERAIVAVVPGGRAAGRLVRDARLRDAGAARRRRSSPSLSATRARCRATRVGRGRSRAGAARASSRSRPSAQVDDELRPPPAAADAARPAGRWRPSTSTSSAGRAALRDDLHERRRARVGRAAGARSAGTSRRLLALLALAALCVALARPHRSTLVASDQATVILVVDVSGSMQASDVKPTRLGAAQAAVRTFLDRVPKHVKVGLIAFAGEPQVAAPPTTDRELVREGLDTLSYFCGLRRHRDRRRARRRGRAGPAGARTARRRSPTRRSQPPGRAPSRSCFLSDGHQTRGLLQPLEGAARAGRGHPRLHGRARHAERGARPVARRLRRPFPPGGGPTRIPVPPDPATLRQIAETTGGKFFDARSAKAVESAYSNLGSVVGRVHAEARGDERVRRPRGDPARRRRRRSRRSSHRACPDEPAAPPASPTTRDSSRPRPWARGRLSGYATPRRRDATLIRRPTISPPPIETTSQATIASTIRMIHCGTPTKVGTAPDGQRAEPHV